MRPLRHSVDDENSDQRRSHDCSSEDCALLVQEWVQDLLEGQLLSALLFVGIRWIVVLVLGFVLGERDVGIDRRLVLDLVGEILHQDRLWDQVLVLEDDVQKEGEEDYTGDDDGYNHVRRILDEGDLECARQDQVGRIRGDQNCRSDIGAGKLREYPRPRMGYVA